MSGNLEQARANLQRAEAFANDPNQTANAVNLLCATLESLLAWAEAMEASRPGGMDCTAAQA